MRHFLGAHAVSCELRGCPGGTKKTRTSVRFAGRDEIQKGSEVCAVSTAINGHMQRLFVNASSKNTDHRPPYRNTAINIKAYKNTVENSFDFRMKFNFIHGDGQSTGKNVSRSGHRNSSQSIDKTIG